MSWAEIFKINNNMKKPINEQLRDMKFQPVRIITSTGTYTPEKTGLYKIICVGAGGSGGYADGTGSQGGSSGGGGGVAIKTLKLYSSTSYSVTVGTTASFAYSDGAITATSGGGGAGASGGGAGGTASGGDYNFIGTRGGAASGNYNTARSGSVGVTITDLSLPGYSIIKETATAVRVEFFYGNSLFGYGAGGAATGYYIYQSGGGVNGSVSIPALPAAIFIIPLELEE